MFGKFTQRMSIQSACIVYSYEKSLFLKMVFIIGRDWFRVTHMSLNSYPCLGISSGTTKVRNSGLGPDPDLSAKSGPE